MFKNLIIATAAITIVADWESTYGQTYDNEILTMFTRGTVLISFVGVIIVALIYGCDNSTGPPIHPPASGVLDKHPSWSVENDLIAYIHNRDSDSSHPDPSGIYTIRPDGSEKRLLYLSDSWDNYDGLDWFPDGRSLITNSGRMLVRISCPDGIADTLTEYGEYWAPSVSPNGNAVAFSRRLGDPAGIYIFEFDGSDSNKIIDDGDAVDWAYGDSLLFLNLDRSYPLYTVMIMAIEDGYRRVVYMPPQNFTPGTVKAKMHIDTRRIVFDAQVIGELQSIWALEPNGVTARKLHELAESPEFSPDGSRILFSRFLGDGRLWIINWDGTGLRRLTQ